MVCKICPHECDLKSGEYGKCKVRTNSDNKIQTGPWFGQCSSIAVDPIEKRPFYHLTPGEKYLSAGFFFCNFSCDNCLNHKVSQNLDVDKLPTNRFCPPLELLNTAIAKNVKGVVFTYSEPTIHWEYLWEFGNRAIGTELLLALKTNGFVTEYALRGLMPLFDAVNVDIKGDEKFYKQNCGGSFKEVKRTIEWIVSQGFWLEISYLVIPSLVDNLVWHKENAKWLASLSPNIPVHILNFYPFHKMKDDYPVEKLERIHKILSEDLKYVYISNTYEPNMIKYRDTHCDICGKTLISRNGEVSKYKCACDGKLPGIFC